jgi:fused signal recognition particle receptor
MNFGLPITYVGLGEKLEDLRPFHGEDFADALLGREPEAGQSGEGSVAR